MTDPYSSKPLADQILVGGGEMGALMRSFDWSKTPLGPVEQWPQSLRSAVSILLPSKAQICLFWGAEFTVLYNDAYCPVLDEKHPRVLGTPGWVCWEEIWEDTLGPLLKGVIATGEAFWARDLLFFLRRSGFTEETYFDVSYDPVRVESGDVGGVFCIVSETTQRVLSERRLILLRELGHGAEGKRSEQETIATAFQCLGMDPLDIPFAILYLQDDAAQAAAVHGFDASAPLPVDRERLSAALQQARETQQAVMIAPLSETLASIPAGAWPEVPHQAVVLPLISPGHRDETLGFLVMGISARLEFNDAYRGFFELCAGQMTTAIVNARAFEEERRRAEALAELNQAKTAFFSNVSHEFRTPLTLLLSPLEDAMRGHQDSTVTLEWDTAQAMHRNTMRLLKLVNTLLDFSRLEAGRTQPTFAPTNLSLLTAELASSFHSAVESAGLQYVVDCPPLPETVYVDRDMWEKIILNLLSNAYKFTHEGGITVSLRPVSGKVMVRVSDTGTGIPEAEQQSIFQRFYRVRNAQARTHEGAGIGLSLVQELVKIHGGSIEVHSQEGIGTTFTVTIPTGTAHLPPEQIERERSLTSTAVDPSAYVMEAERWFATGSNSADGSHLVDHAADDTTREDLPPGRLLVVDDNADMREYLRRLLQQTWKVDTAADGAAALTAIDQRIPDLVLTDIMMPGIDGFELLRRLRANPDTAHVPVIMLSARAGEEASVEGFGAGANDYLVKPFSSRELFARVRTQLIAAQHAAEQRDQHEVSRRIAVADSAEDILLGLAHSAHFKDSISAGLFWFNRPWEDSEPDYGDILASWSAHSTHNDLTGIRFDFKTYGLSLLAAPDRPVLIRDSSDPALLPSARAALTAIGSRSFITLPLIAQGLARGYLFAHWDYVQRCTEAEIRSMQQLADLAAAALHNILLLKSEASARKAAEQANLLKMRFMAMISHELRTPLASIKGFASTMLVPDVNYTAEEQREFVEIIDDESDKLMNLIEQLLDLTRMQAGTFGVNPVPISMRHILDSAMAQLRSLTVHHTLSIQLPDRLPRVSADTLRVGQVLTNLVNNARKFSPPGSTITINAVRDHEFVRVDVTDQGPGIPAENYESIFQPFQQIETRTDNRATSGVGLGLTIARGIVEAHGGTIWVQPQTTPGATVSFTLPIAPDDWKDRLQSEDAASA
jgi:signal transduction histidine kinase